MNRYAIDSCTVVVEAAPQSRRTVVRITGDLDADAVPALNDAVDRIAALLPGRVVVDLADVPYAGSALPNFLVRLVGALPAMMPVVVCRPQPLPRWVLDTTGMEHILTISPDPPR